MNLADVRLRVKKTFGDEAQVQINDSDIVRWVNDAQRHIISSNELLLQKIATADVIATQQDYALPSDLFMLRSISMKSGSISTYYPLQGSNQADFNALLGGWDTNTISQGIPAYYHVFANILKLYPIPQTTVTAGLKLFYTRYPTDLSIDTDVIDLPLAYHNTVVDYCLQQAYELDEDWNAVKSKQEQVELSLHRNKGREDRQPTLSYQTITTLPEDM